MIKKSIKYYMGIDPGKQTGIALWNRDKQKFGWFATGKFWDAIDLIDKVNEDKGTCMTIVELPVSKSVWHDKATAKGAIQRTGFNVGTCYAKAELIIEYLKKKQFLHKTVRPQGGVNAAKFKQITGYQLRTNQHVRDAAMMCFGY